MCRVELLGCVWTALVNLISMYIVWVCDEINVLEILDLCYKVLQWSGFSKFGFIVLLHFFNAPLEELTGHIPPVSGCIYLGNWMPCYPTNIFLAWITSPWGSHDMLFMNVISPLPLCSWGYLKNLHWLRINKIQIYILLPFWIWQENDLFGLSILSLILKLLQIQDEFLRCWIHCDWDLCWYFIFPFLVQVPFNCGHWLW